VAGSFRGEGLEPVKEPDTIERHRLLAAVCVIATVTVYWARSLYRAFRDGTISTRFGKFRRDKDPSNYWFSVSTSAFGLLVLVSTGIAMLVVAFGP
jgi:hypothetical protein